MRNFVAIIALAAALFVALAPDAAVAQDQNRARGLVGSGEALPLGQVLSRIGGGYGDLLDARLANSRGRTVYQLRMLDRAGTVRDVTVDAATGQVLGVREGGRR